MSLFGRWLYLTVITNMLNWLTFYVCRMVAGFVGIGSVDALLFLSLFISLYMTCL